MKIVYIANIRLPTERAHGIQIMKMAEAFSAEGADVKLLVPRRFNHIKKDAFDYYGVRRNFSIIALPCLDLVLFGSGTFGFLVQALTFLVSAKVYLLFNRRDIIYSREQFAGFFFRNCVFEIHALPKQISATRKMLWRRAKALIVLTDIMKNEIVSSGIGMEKILTAPDGVDLSHFHIAETQASCRKRLKLPMEKPIVLYAGHLYKWKGIHTLALAAEHLKDAWFVFVGGIPEDVDFFTKRYGKISNILTIGQKPYSEIPLYMCSADVVVLPNSAEEEISRLYTSPLKLFEYMASGRPIVASDIPSVREILNDKTAYFFRPDDPKDLARVLGEALDSKKEAAEKASNAFSQVKKYTWEKRAERIMSFVNQH